jgi:hypothetical protein
MAEHAHVGPSSLERVSLCAGSVAATRDSKNTTNRAAAEGSVLHGIAEECLTLGMEPWDYLGRTMTYDGHQFTIGEDDGDTDPQCMVDALDWIREQPGEIFVEQRVSLDPWMPGQFGTCDLGIYTPSLLTVFDWKFGWIAVPVERNKQIRAYAIGLIKLLRERGYKIPKRIRLIIEQPRPPGAPRYFTPWEITLDELMGFTAELEQIWAAANDPNAPRAAGIKQCMFCTAKDEPGGCYAHSEFMLDLVSQKFEDLDEPEAELELPPVGVITPERRSVIIRHKHMIKGWLDDLAEQALQDGLAELPTPGLKVIDGDLGNRAWTDPVAAEAILVAHLAENAFTKKLISPPASAKLFEPKSKKKPGHPELWDKLTPLITRPAGKPILVPVEDPRPARIAVDEKFEEETEEL